MSAVLNGRRVLIVEDESVVGMMIEDMLRDLGCSIAGVAPSTKTALAALDGGPAPDAVVLDLNLDGFPSYEVADALVARRVPFLIVTGYGEDVLADRHGHRPILRKPFLDEDLARGLAQALDAGASAKAAAFRRAVVHAR